jgi:hypothetical protein
MAVPRILMTGSARTGPDKLAEIASESRAWDLLGTMGLAFVLIGLLDIGLAWFPAAFGSPEWEFGTIASTLNGLTVPALGLMLLLAGGMAQGRSWQMRAASVVFFALALALIGLAIVFITVVPVALSEVTNDLARSGILKAIAKSVALFVIYPVLFGWAGFQGLRRARSR